MDLSKYEMPRIEFADRKIEIVLLLLNTEV